MVPARVFGPQASQARSLANILIWNVALKTEPLDRSAAAEVLNWPLKAAQRNAATLAGCQQPQMPSRATQHCSVSCCCQLGCDWLAASAPQMLACGLRAAAHSQLRSVSQIKPLTARAPAVSRIARQVNMATVAAAAPATAAAPAAADVKVIFRKVALLPQPHYPSVPDVLLDCTLPSAGTLARISLSPASVRKGARKEDASWVHPAGTTTPARLAWPDACQPDLPHLNPLLRAGPPPMHPHSPCLLAG